MMKPHIRLNTAEAKGAPIIYLRTYYNCHEMPCKHADSGHSSACKPSGDQPGWGTTPAAALTEVDRAAEHVGDRHVGGDADGQDAEVHEDGQRQVLEEQEPAFKVSVSIIAVALDMRAPSCMLCGALTGIL
jgi:hypothetical protein